MEWQPIETAPRDGTRILMADNFEIETGCWVEAWRIPNTHTTFPAGFQDDRYEAASYFAPGETQPTHWMPLPKGPSHG